MARSTLREQAVRMIRQPWVTATQLGEELFAIFRALGDQPFNINQPVTIDNADNSTTLKVIKNVDGDEYTIVVEGHDDDGDGIPDTGGINVIGGSVDIDNGDLNISGEGAGLSLDGGDLTITDGNLVLGPNVQLVQQDANDPSVVTQVSFGDMATVSSGAGDTYTVSLLSNGKSVTAKVMGIDTSETVPAGSVFPIIRVGTTYYLDVPLWL